LAEDPWVNGNTDEMAKHVSMDGPKTEFAKERLAEVNVGDKMAAHWMD
jgi:hypothetical protein